MNSINGKPPAAQRSQTTLSQNLKERSKERSSPEKIELKKMNTVIV